MEQLCVYQVRSQYHLYSHITAHYLSVQPRDFALYM